MRSYIFTELERRIIREWLKGEATDAWRKIKHRVLSFKTLEADVELYLKIREKLKQG